MKDRTRAESVPKINLLKNTKSRTDSAQGRVFALYLDSSWKVQVPGSPGVAAAAPGKRGKEFSVRIT